jgi:hypothetical protein
VALNKCPECEREVSEKAVSCPHCGFPVGSFFRGETKTPASSNQRTDFLRKTSRKVVYSVADFLNAPNKRILIKLTIPILFICIVLFVCLYIIEPCGGNECSECIKKVIVLDIEYSNPVRKASNNREKYLLALDDFLYNAGQIDLSGCPRKFHSAYDEHLAAWESRSDYYKEITKKDVNEMMDVFGSSSITEAIGKLLQYGAKTDIPDYKNHDIGREIRSTWKLVKEIALSYGIDVDDELEKAKQR